MIEWRVQRQLDKARSRWRHARVLHAATLVWLGGIIVSVLVLALWFVWQIALPRPMESISALAVIALLVTIGYVIRQCRDRREIARRVEEAFPDLQASLLAALDIQPDAKTGHVGYLQDRVVLQVLSHAYQHGWQQLVPARRLVAAHVLHLAMLTIFVLGLWQLYVVPSNRLTAGQEGNEAEIIVTEGQFEVTVEPGNAEIERGTALLVLARFQGPLPPDATLVHRSTQQPSKDGDEPKVSEGRIVMTKALDDPLFGGSVSSVDGPLEYYVEFAGQRTESFRIGVFEFPRLVRADARLQFPRFASMEDKIVRDVRQLTAVVGTKITLTLEMNKPLASARLIEKDGFTLEAAPNRDQPQNYSVEFVLDRSHRFALQLTDAQGRSNKETAELIFTAISNQPPDLKLAAPGKDTQVSPLEELELKAKAFDDFGLHRVGLTYAIAGQDEQELTLAQHVAGKERLELAHVVALENLQAEPDQLLSYYFWAEDAGPDGSVRRTSSDMFFAEVRPFEEIFRQGQQPPGGSQQQQQQNSANANAAEKLAELQKEIMSGTWKVVRREASGKLSDAFGSDVELLVESQSTALKMTEQLAEKVQDPQSMRHVDDARRHMNNAIRELLSAKEQSAPTPLRPALDAEQQAYQALLKLRAREHQVTRSQSQRGASRGGASSRSQQQLDQLELKDQQNRYETERTAQAPEDPVEREMRQVLNRLKELARRQGDLNDRLKEVQTALQQAQTEEQKEELRRQLKRLQEEQEQLLRDTEELQARMEQPQNAQRMADSREQLENARDRVRQSSEALREGMVPQAAAAGARAEQDFEQLRDEFRRQTSDRFQQEVRELSEQAKQLDEREQRIAEQLQQLQAPNQSKTSLRDGGEREKLLEGLGEQKQRSNELLDRMRQTIQDAEGPQPLLAEQLYDTVRRTQQRNLSQNLETTQEAIRRGLMEPARQQEEMVRSTISELRAGVDRAAQSVLEDETGALRRAQDALQDLSQQLRDELAQNGQPNDPQNGQPDENSAKEDQSPEKSGNGSPSKNEKGDKSAEGQTKDGADKDGNKSGDSKGGESKNGESKGESKGGESKGGESKGGEAKGGDAKGGEAKGGGSSSGNGQSESSSQESNASPGNPNGEPRDGRQRTGTPGERNGDRGGFDQLAGPTGGGGNERLLAPFSGEDFRQWSDRLRDVEEMLGDPQLSAEAARIRERARALRADSKRHSAPPNWDLIKLQVSQPLTELLERVHTELLKRTKSDLLVPLDRDPVPPEYVEPVRKYYERLGRGN